MNLPIIKISVDHMRQDMVHAFSAYSLEMDEMFKKAIKEACAPERLEEIITDAARRHLHDSVESEIKAFFDYGEGRKIISERVTKLLISKMASKADD